MTRLVGATSTSPPTTTSQVTRQTSRNCGTGAATGRLDVTDDRSRVLRRREPGVLGGGFGEDIAGCMPDMADPPVSLARTCRQSAAEVTESGDYFGVKSAPNHYGEDVA